MTYAHAWRGQSRIEDAESRRVVDHRLEVGRQLIPREPFKEAIELVAATYELDRARAGSAVSEAVNMIPRSEGDATLWNLGPIVTIEDLETPRDNGEHFIFVLMSMRRDAAAMLAGLSSDGKGATCRGARHQQLNWLTEDIKRGLHRSFPSSRLSHKVLLSPDDLVTLYICDHQNH